VSTRLRAPVEKPDKHLQLLMCEERSYACLRRTTWSPRLLGMPWPQGAAYTVFSTQLYAHEMFGSREFITILESRPKVFAHHLARLLKLKMQPFRQCFLIWLH